MSDAKGYAYVPDVPIAPGETIVELLEERAMSQRDLALKLGRSDKNISQLVNGDAPLDHELAIDLERVFGVPAPVWNSLESNYRDLRARHAEQERLAGDVAWTKSFPIREMEKRGFIAHEATPTATTVVLLEYFGVASPEAHTDYWGSERRLAARMTSSFTADIPALTAWLRQGEIQASQLPLPPYDSSLFRKAVSSAATCTREDVDVALPRVTSAFADAGVALVFVPELPGIRVSGVSHWISEQTPLIELCLRYKTADQLWFSLFHEACHVLRHSKKRTWVGFLGEDTPEERDANDFAADIMIPRRQWEAFVGGGKPSKARALEFARLVGVHPGIVVGRLQHEGLIPFNHMNALKQPIEWADA